MYTDCQYVETLAEVLAELLNKLAEPSVRPIVLHGNVPCHTNLDNVKLLWGSLLPQEKKLDESIRNLIMVSEKIMTTESIG